MSKQQLDDWFHDIADKAAVVGWDDVGVRQQLDALSTAEARYLATRGKVPA